jgi:putative tricarboxylic transport membrane protein
MKFDSANADRLTALILFALGAAMAVGGYYMDRLEIRQIHPASIPGLLPMILGAALALCAVLLFTSAQQLSDPKSDEEVQRGWAFGNLSDLGFTAIYTVGYALGLVGRLPFEVATAIFIAVFVLHFTYKSDAQPRGKMMAVGGALVYAGLCSVAVSALFRYAFLVRLP